jgi:regulatory protein
MGLDPDAIDRILLYLLTEDYVNVRRYVRSYIHDKHNLQHWGRKRIRHELSRRLLPQAEINAGLAEIDDVTYRADLLRLLRRRYKQAKGDTPQALYRKLQNHALGLGYEPTLINQCLKQLLIAYTPPDTEDD